MVQSRPAVTLCIVPPQAKWSLLVATKARSTRSQAGLQRTAQRAPAGFPARDESRRRYDQADLNRAIEAYRFFYPTVSGAAILRGHADAGIVDNKVFGVMDSNPRHVGFTYDSDSPYGPMQLDLSGGPFVIELPPGPLSVSSMDINQRWVADMGVPGPDAGRGGKHLIVPPDYRGDIPDGYHLWQSTSNRLMVGVRAMPVNGDVKLAMERVTRVRVHPLHPGPDWSEPKWVNLTDTPQDTSPVRWENNITYWEVLNDVIQTEPAFLEYREFYGELAALGIVKGKAFTPDARMRRILEQAATTAIGQMRAQAFDDRRADRIVWADRKWEWIGLRPENADFETASYVDLDAREVWFYQAVGASPTMFRRKTGHGLLYWLGLRDRQGEYLDGARSYTLIVPQPVPAELCWSVTVYDAETRSQIQTDQGRAALRSMFELRDQSGANAVELSFGPNPPKAHAEQWIRTIPGRGWFVYFRVYGPEAAAFDGSWKPGDFAQAGAGEV
jgi:hypothetical protein